MRQPVAENHLSRLLAVSLPLVCLVGCGSEYGATVSGTVTLDGNPVTPGFVTFASEENGARPATSDLSTSGEYTLKTQKKLGLRPGKYRVAVQSYKPPPGMVPGQRTMQPAVPTVPEKYLQTTTSGLEFTVEPGSNTIDIPLTSTE